LRNEDKEISFVNKVNEWTEKSLIRDFLTFYYKEEGFGDDPLKKDLKIFEENSMYILKQWKTLTAEQKKKYPLGLQNILDNVSGKTIKNQNKNRNKNRINRGRKKTKLS
jgi:hypothetical protein